MPASILALVAGGFSLLGFGCCAAWGRLHWGGLFAADLALITAVTSLLLHRSRAGWCVLVVAILTFVFCAFAGRVGHGLLS